MSRNPNAKDLLNPFHFLSLGLGSGLLKPAPGTWGTLAALPIWWFGLAELSWPIYLLMLLMTFAVGVFLCGGLLWHCYQRCGWPYYWVLSFFVFLTLLSHIQLNY